MRRFLTIFQYIFFFAIGVFLLWLAFRNQDKEAIIEGFRNAEYSWVFLSLTLMMLSHISRGIRWTLLIKPLGFRVSGFNSFVAVMIGYFANLALPRMGEISRCVVLNRTDHVPFNRLVGTVFVERVFDFLTLLSIVFITFIIELDRLKGFYFDKIHPYLMNQLQQVADFKLILGVVIFLAVILGLIQFLRTRYRENPIVSKLRNLVKEFISGIKTIRSMENNRLFLAHTVFIWFMYWAMTYVVFFALDSTSHLGVPASLTAFSVGSMGFIMPVQGGIGTYHWAVKEGLKLYDLPVSDGLTYATLVHGSQFFTFLVFGALSFLAFILIKRKNAANEQAVRTDQEENLPAS